MRTTYWDRTSLLGLHHLRYFCRRGKLDGLDRGRKLRQGLHQGRNRQSCRLGQDVSVTGCKVALSTQDGHFLLDFSAAQVEEHIGHEVTIKGELDPVTNTIKVSDVSMSHSH